MGFAKSPTEAYYLPSEKTMRFDSPPVPPASRRAAPAAPAPAWAGGSGGLGSCVVELPAAALTGIRRFKLEVYES